MIDINWDEQPTDKHCWLEAVKDIHNDESGWYILKGDEWVHERKGMWHEQTEGGSFTVHRKPIEPYKPVVGERCEYKHFDSSLSHNDTWQACFYIGKDEGGENIFRSKLDGELYCDDTIFRPIKTEREQFIEKSVELAGGAEEWVRYGIQYDNGARFKGPYK